MPSRLPDTTTPREANTPPLPERPTARPVIIRSGSDERIGEPIISDDHIGIRDIKFCTNNYHFTRAVISLRDNHHRTDWLAPFAPPSTIKEHYENIVQSVLARHRGLSRDDQDKACKAWIETLFPDRNQNIHDNNNSDALLSFRHKLSHNNVSEDNIEKAIFQMLDTNSVIQEHFNIIMRGDVPSASNDNPSASNDNPSISDNALDGTNSSINPNDIFQENLYMRLVTGLTADLQPHRRVIHAHARQAANIFMNNIEAPLTVDNALRTAEQQNALRTQLAEGLTGGGLDDSNRDLIVNYFVSKIRLVSEQHRLMSM